MEDDLKPLPAGGWCCGPTLTLARETVTYSEVERVLGGWQVTSKFTEDVLHRQSVRLFCPDCGTYFHIPEDLP